MSKFAIGGGIISILPAAFYVILTLGYRMDAVSFGTIFKLLPMLVPALLFGAVLAFFSSGFGMMKGMPMMGLTGLIMAVSNGAMAYGPIQMKKLAGEVPPIHDITTDTDNPPTFMVTAPERTSDENPAAYDREQTPAQLEYYTDLAPIKLEASSDAVFKAAEAAMKTAGVKIVAANAEAGTIEGTVTTKWFGFKDDVVLRIVAAEDGTSIVDIRSKSRFGRSDLGANAARIRTIRDSLLDDLKPAAG